jgi:hypothetical protein
VVFPQDRDQLLSQRLVLGGELIQLYFEVEGFHFPVQLVPLVQ